MEGFLDTPEFNSMLSILLDDLASGEFADHPPMCESENFVTPHGSISCDTCSIGTETKKYILTRVEMNTKPVIEKNDKKDDKKTALIKSSKHAMGKPRMVKTDVRSSYAQMMSNTFNSLDLRSIMGLIQTYSMPDIKLRFKKRHPITDKLTVIELFGPLNLSNLLYCNLTISPDCVTTLLSSKFDPESGVVTCTLQFRMTKVYNVHSIHQVLPNMVVEPVHADNSSKDGTEGVTAAVNAVQIVESFDSLKKGLSLRKNPVSVVHNVKLIIATNVNKRMCEMRGSLQVVENDFSVEE